MVRRQGFFHRARQRAGLPNIGGIHTLRHSFATHQLLAGMDLMRLKYVLGHKNLITTMRYLHLIGDADYDGSLSPLERGSAPAAADSPERRKL